MEVIDFEDLSRELELVVILRPHLESALCCGKRCGRTIANPQEAKSFTPFAPIPLNAYFGSFCLVHLTEKSSPVSSTLDKEW